MAFNYDLLGAGIAEAIRKALIVSVENGPVGNQGEVVREHVVAGSQASDSGGSWADQVEDDIASASGGVVVGGSVGQNVAGGGVGVGECAQVNKQRGADGVKGDGKKPGGVARGSDVGRAQVALPVNGTWAGVTAAQGPVPVDLAKKKPAGGFMANHVRSPEVVAFRETIQLMCGKRLPTSTHCGVDLALARYTAATVPDAFVQGRSRLVKLALVGDAAVASAALTVMYRSGRSLEEMQGVKAKGLSDTTMKRKFAGSELAKHVVVGTGIDLAVSKTGATALEAIAGVLHLHVGAEAVVNYLVALGLTGGLFVGDLEDNTASGGGQAEASPGSWSDTLVDIQQW